MDESARQLLDVLHQADAPPARRREAAEALARRLESVEVERGHLITALERAAGELETRVQELSLLRRLSEVLAQVVDGSELGQRVLEALAAEQDVEDAALWLTEGEELVWRCGLGRGQAVPGQAGGPPLNVPLNEGSIGQAACRTDPLVVHDGESEGRSRNSEPLLRQGSCCLFPLASSGRSVGVLWLGSLERFAFPSERVRILAMAASEIAQGLAASELFERLSRFNEDLSELVADRSRALEEMSRELARYKAAMAEFWRRLHVGAHAATLQPLPGCERLDEAGRHLGALLAASGGSSGTLHTAATLLASFTQDYQAYMEAMGHVSFPVLLEPAARETAEEPDDAERRPAA
ncbi:MAG TPA: GAF domain-containing protein [Candidatus Saccharimonadales bacterium]|nr:GAF domain-containing protein [Candidatus Saccharimonadales bacterium]